jgi:DNA (cytosine-5)-methyltransferase 1
MISNNEFAILDLFSGAGGLTEGFSREGFQFIAHIDKDKNALNTLETRSIFHSLEIDKNIDSYISYINGETSRDDFLKEAKPYEQKMGGIINEEFSPITQERIIREIEKFRRRLDIKDVDIIIGGPPCQAFSPVGRSRDPDRMKYDPRNYLYRYYLKILKFFKPKMFVFENVPGMKNAKQGSIFESFRSEAQQYGYVFEDRHQNAKDFFVLQNRERLIIMGWRLEYDLEYPSFRPMPHDYRVSCLLGDLPPLVPGGGSEGPQSYMGPPSEYLRRTKIRSDNDILIQHSARNHNERDRTIYRRAIEIWNKEHRRLRYDELPEELKTHKNRTSFKDRFKVVEGDREYVHSILAHLSQDGHYFIHPDINQARSITVREAARIQSFPDNYKFEGSRSSQFQQIGNAVPPLMAQRIAQSVYQMMVSL